MERYGASPEAWDHFADTLGLTEDLLPVVSSPHAEISPNSTMKALGKTPSLYNRARKAVGLPKWTNIKATTHDVMRWRSDPDLGICLQTRHVRAFDIDVPDLAKSSVIREAILAITGPLPLRYRSFSGKMLLAFKYNRPLTKHVVPVDGGIVEVLADGQQFIAAGMHPDGEPYLWQDGLPETIPVLTKEQFDKVWEMLVTLYATGEPRIARERRKGSGSDLAVHDEVVDWLVENWEVYDVGADGQAFIECPFADQHTSDSGATSTAYFPAGTGGYQQGHFVCLHAHCTGREDRDYLDATGYSLAQFADLGPVERLSSPAGSPGLGAEPDLDGELGRELDPSAASGRTHGVDERTGLPAIAQVVEEGLWPVVVRDKKGKIEPTAESLFVALQHGGMIHRHLAYDAFSDNLMWAPFGQRPAQWQRFADADMVGVRIELERRGFKPMGKEMLREVVHAAAAFNRIDTAIEWLNRLTWDGVPRIERFAIDCWGWKDTPYARAVGNYVWSAMGGRVLQPGVRADMAPILVGLQGIKKTSAIQAMVPHEDFYAEIRLDEKDDNISRKLRGKLIGELEELRGLNTRAIEEIKAFVSRRRESWVPKFKEFEAFFLRRNLLVGSTNDDQFLADPTGERRWLPGECEFIDLDRIIETRDQLWAEGATMFRLEGVMWEDAERLAPAEHRRFKIGDTWEHAIRGWLVDGGMGGGSPLDKGYVTAGEVLVGALGVGIAQQDRRHEIRVSKALRAVGLKETMIDVEDGTLRGFRRG